jgi:hypothetical protein
MKKIINLRIVQLPFIAICMLSFSCQESSFSNTEVPKVKDLPSFADFYGKITKVTDGKIVIQSTTGLGSQNEIRNNSIETNFQNSNVNADAVLASINDVKIGNGLSARESSTSIESLFGTTAKIGITKSLPNSRTEDASGEIYIPKLLTIQSKLDELFKGQVVLWNADPKNENGVTVKLEYRPQSQSKQNIAIGNPSYLINGFIVPDDGKLIITKEMIAIFPNGSELNLTIARGNIDFIDNNEKIYSTGALTAVYTRSTVKN